MQNTYKWLCIFLLVIEHLHTILVYDLAKWLHTDCRHQSSFDLALPFSVHTHHNLFCFLLLCFSDIVACFFCCWWVCFFYKLKVVATLCLAILSEPFLQQHLFTVCLVSHFGNPHTFPNIIIIIIFVMMICDQLSLMSHGNCSEVSGTMPIKDSELMDKCFVCVLIAPKTSFSPISLPLLRPPYSPRQNNL